MKQYLSVSERVNQKEFVENVKARLQQVQGKYDEHLDKPLKELYEKISKMPKQKLQEIQQIPQVQKSTSFAQNLFLASLHKFEYYLPAVVKPTYTSIKTQVTAKLGRFLPSVAPAVPTAAPAETKESKVVEQKEVEIQSTQETPPSTSTSSSSSTVEAEPEVSTTTTPTPESSAPASPTVTQSQPSTVGGGVKARNRSSKKSSKH